MVRLAGLKETPTEPRFPADAIQPPAVEALPGWRSSAVNGNGVSSRGELPSSPDDFEAMLADYVADSYRVLYQSYQELALKSPPLGGVPQVSVNGNGNHVDFKQALKKQLLMPLGKLGLPAKNGDTKSDSPEKTPRTPLLKAPPGGDWGSTTPRTPRPSSGSPSRNGKVGFDDDTNGGGGSGDEKPKGRPKAVAFCGGSVLGQDDRPVEESWTLPGAMGLDALLNDKRSDNGEKKDFGEAMQDRFGMTFPRATKYGRSSILNPGDDPVLAQVRTRIINQSVGTVLRQVSEHFLNEPVQHHACLGRIVCSKAFESVCSLVITINTIFIAYASNYAMDNLHDPETPLMKAIEVAFTVFYVIELVLRIIVFQATYICSIDWAWNLLDVLLVLVSLQELIMTSGIVTNSEGSLNVSFLRVLRVMKMMKLFRVVRLLRMFRELRLIWSSIVGCVKAIFWAMVLIAATSFMCGVCFLQACTFYIRENEQDLSLEELTRLKSLWGTVQHSMLSLYMCVTNGADWAEVADSLVRAGHLYYMLFLLYILFYTCVISNTLTSLFVESTMANADKDQQYVIQNALEQSDKIIDKLHDWFHDVDIDGNGYVTYEEFCMKLQDPRSVAFASTLNIEVTDLKQFFSVLSRNGKQTVDLETFVVGCIKLRGAARSMDLMEFMYFQRTAVQQAKKQATQFQEMMMTQLEVIKQLQREAIGRVGLLGRARPACGGHRASLPSTLRQSATVPLTDDDETPQRGRSLTGGTSGGETLSLS
eukprot:TRINITY_DN12281_c0_g3_i1.p1 TRINITY_DN12281_c0_g3~~TRINITY_DN12281_c0_g3_i1.p1  ORF type:complete len:761 (+),score=146.88 TRINITY_DN12281_c0_g3_i1:81-2363(+)